MLASPASSNAAFLGIRAALVASQPSPHYRMSERQDAVACNVSCVRTEVDKPRLGGPGGQRLVQKHLN